MRRGQRTFPSWTATAEGHSLLIRRLYVSSCTGPPPQQLAFAVSRLCLAEGEELPTLTVVFVEAAFLASKREGLPVGRKLDGEPCRALW